MLRFALLLATLWTAWPSQAVVSPGATKSDAGKTSAVKPVTVPPATEQQIDAMIEAGKTSEAVALIQAVLRTASDWQPGLWRLGNLLYGADRFVPARQAFLRLTELDPRQGAPWALLGLSDFAMHDYSASADHIQQGLALGFPAQLNLTGTCYLQLSLAMLATEKFDRALAVLTGMTGEPDTLPMRQQAAGLAGLRIAALPDDAMRLLPPPQRALVLEVGRLELGVARSEIDDSRQRWQRLVEANPDVAGLHSAFAKYLVASGDGKAAEPEFQAELTRSPKDVNALLGLGFVLMEQGRLDEAAAASSRALQLDPNSANGHHLLGMLDTRRGRYPQALEELKASRDLDPNLSRVHYALSQVYLKLHQPAEAAQEAALYRKLKASEESFHDTGRLTLAAADSSTGKAADKSAADKSAGDKSAGDKSKEQP